MLRCIDNNEKYLLLLLMVLDGLRSEALYGTSTGTFSANFQGMAYLED